mmetsp:Transcript_11391/g.17231  ORF Transcript_11391/g.17231 Transcript_11391/m.17231 type:complete len:135 (+) Transcript_11391:159-563(+)
MGEQTASHNWSMGLFEACCSEGPVSCLWATFCYCCAHGQNHAKFHEETEVPQEPCSMICTAPCWIDFGLSCIGLYFLMPCLLRADIRTKFEIDQIACCDCGCGHCCDDCCTELCCVYGCSLMQTKVTLKEMMEG